MLAGSTQNHHILKELLDNLYFIYEVFNIEQVNNVFQIIKAKYNSIRSRDQTLPNSKYYPMIYPPKIK